MIRRLALVAPVAFSLGNAPAMAEGNNEQTYLPDNAALCLPVIEQGGLTGEFARVIVDRKGQTSAEISETPCTPETEKMYLSGQGSAQFLPYMTAEGDYLDTPPDTEVFDLENGIYYDNRDPSLPEEEKTHPLEELNENDLNLKGTIHPPSKREYERERFPCSALRECRTASSSGADDTRSLS